jgi:hypothetical protein
MLAAQVIMENWSGFSQQKLCLVPIWCKTLNLLKILRLATTVALSDMGGLKGSRTTEEGAPAVKVQVLSFSRPEQEM